MQTAIGNDLTAEDAGTIACSGYVSKVLILIVSGLIVYILAYYVQMFWGETIGIAVTREFNGDNMTVFDNIL